MRSFIGGALGGNVGLCKLEIRGGGLLELGLGAGVIGGIRFFLRGSPAGAVGGGFADQADLEFSGVGLCFGDIEGGFGLIDCGLIRTRVNLQESVAVFDGSVVVEEKFNDIAGNLRSNGGDVAIDLSVVGGNLPGVNVPSDGKQNEEQEKSCFYEGIHIADTL